MTMIRLFVIVLLTVSAWASFHCPPAEQIHPCECQMHPVKTVRCNDVFSLASVRTSLEGQFDDYYLPRLHLTNVHSFSLPSHALGDLAPKRFELSDSNIRHIDEEAFEGQQSSLGLLILSEDRLEDIPTEALHRLTSLKSLSLAGNFLMRVKDRSLDGLFELRSLVLYNNRISEIGKKAFPKSLENLILSRNLLSTFNGSLQQLDHLYDLHATDNRLTNVRGELNGLSHLRHLNLDRNHIRDLSGIFSDLTSLRFLSLSGNQIQDVGKNLADLSLLRSLNLSRNYISEIHWRMFDNMKDLQILDLSGNYLKSVCPTLKPLKSVRELYLSDLGLKSLHPDCFRNMKFLRNLDLSHNRLNSTEAISRHPLPNLSYLKLNHNHLTALRHELKYAKNLRELDISFNDFSSLKAHQLANNQELITLIIEGNPWKCTESTTMVFRDLENQGVELHGYPDC